MTLGVLVSLLRDKYMQAGQSAKTSIMYTQTRENKNILKKNK